MKKGSMTRNHTREITTLQNLTRAQEKSMNTGISLEKVPRSYPRMKPDAQKRNRADNVPMTEA